MSEVVKTREQWLQEAADVMQMWLHDATNQEQEPVTVSVGFPGKSGNLSQILGVCYSVKYSTDGKQNIFISPIVAGDPAGEQGVLATLLHELCHASGAHGHKSSFAKVAGSVGLLPPWTATKASPELQVRLRALASLLGSWPHAEMLLPARKERVSTVMLGTALGHEARLVVPNQTLTGEPLPSGLLAEIMEQLAGWFGGFTAWKADGGYIRHDNGQLLLEGVCVIDVSAPRNQQSINQLEAIALKLKDLGDQESVYVRLPSGKVELI